MASFELARKRTDGNEGGWADNPNDAGGETFRGISRNNFPKWQGWPVIDQEKKKLGAVPKLYGGNAYRVYVEKLNARLFALPLLMKWVEDFFRVNFWSPNMLDEVQSQEVADWIYDHAVNGGARGVMWVQEAAGVKADGDIGPVSLAAINAIPPAKLLQEAEDVAAFYRLDRAAADPSQIQFLPSWLRRDGVSQEEINQVMQAAKDGLTYTEVAALKRLIQATA
jgi:lysozyme family protein